MIAGWIDDAELIEWVVSSVERICDAAEQAGPDADVESCEGWAVADLVDHVGRLCPGWYTYNLTMSMGDADPRASFTSAPRFPAAFDDRLDYTRRGAATFAEAAGRADLDAEVWAFGKPAVARFWVLRAATEMAVHAWDVEAVLGETIEIPATRAATSVDEHHRAMYRMLRVVAAAEAGASHAHVEVPELPAEPIGVRASDVAVAWRIQSEDDDVVVTVGADLPETVVEGSAHELVLYQYGRIAPSSLRRSGDSELLDRWNLWGHDVYR